MSNPQVMRFIEPAHPKLVETPPSGPGWIHEIKFDGYRTQIIIQDGSARALTKKGIDWSDRYAPVIQACQKLKCVSAIIDGEMILPNAAGSSDFRGLQSGLSRRAHELVFVAFDLLHLDGQDLRLDPLEERRGRLRKLLARQKSPKLAFSQDFAVEGAEAFAAAERMGLEGIVSKKLGSPYRSGNNRSWFKTKCFELGQFELIGIDQDRSGVPLALLADGARYRGPAFITLPSESRQRLYRYIEKNRLDRSPIQGLKRKTGVWVKPGLAVEARYLRGEDMLRHATLTGVGTSDVDQS